MYNKIKNIFKNKIIENVQDITDTSYYYFYQDHTCKVIFGVKKDISISEYLMLSTMFVEKKTYFVDKKQQLVGEYLFVESSYPFKKDTNFIIYSVAIEDEPIVSKLFEDIYKNVIIIKYLKYSVIFGDFDNNIKDTFQALSSDLGYDIKANLGFNITESTKGKDIIEYINYYDNFVLSNEFTNVSDVVISANNKNVELIKTISKNTVIKIKEQPTFIEIINVLFKNNLNVSLTSKLLYMHRNSLLNKIEQIKKTTGLDILNFKEAFALKILLDI